MKKLEEVSYAQGYEDGKKAKNKSKETREAESQTVD